MTLRFSCALIFVLVCPSVSRAQHRIPEKTGCARCSIKIQELGITLGNIDGAGAFGTVPWYVRSDERGRFLVYAGKFPMLFAANGTFIGELGRSGRGPGELSGPSFPIPIAGDSVLVLEPLLSRASLFGPNRRFVRSVRLPGMLGRGVVLNWPDSVVLLGQIHTRGRFGFPLHTVSLSATAAEVLTSGGPDEHRLDEKVYILTGPPESRHVWSSPPDAYKITRWNTGLSADVAFERIPRWWSKVYAPVGTPNSPPSTAITAILEDDQGLVWVFIRSAGDHWREAWPRGRLTEIPDHLIEYDKLLKTIIEVIDPSKAQVVTRATLNRYVVAAVPGPRALIYAPSAEGAPRLRVVQLSIVGR